MDVTISPGRACGTVAAPPSKSCAHRLLLGAALAEGRSTIRGLSRSQDVQATLDCIAALGASVCFSGETAQISGGRNLSENVLFPCRESGSTLRFLLPLTLVRKNTAVFTGAPRLMERGISVYETLFAEKGISVVKSETSVTASGQLLPGTYTVSGGVSSQFITGLLYVLPLLDGNSALRVLPPVESRPYIDLTVEILRKFGIQIFENEPGSFLIPGRQRYHSMDAAVEGDWSNAAPLLALSRLGGDVTVTGLDSESLQADRVCLRTLDRLETQNASIDLSDCPDLGPVLFAAAAAKHGAVFTGTRRLRIKESDRAAVMAEELSKFGIRTELSENSFTVLPGLLRAPGAPLSGHNDHRIVMALTLLCTQTGGTITGADAIKKSYPGFFADLRSLGIHAEETG